MTPSFGDERQHRHAAEQGQARGEAARQTQAGDQRDGREVGERLPPMFVPGADRGPDDERAERDERASVAAPGGIEGAGRSTAAELHPDAEHKRTGDD